jgi:dihydrolipoamide dehydrogenase
MTETTADIVILGGGSGGYACALRAAELGLSVTLIDEAELGGTCLHRGCIPTKALLHSAEVADTARESESVGVHAKLEGIDMPAVLKYKDGVVARLYKGLQGLITSRGVNVVAGRGTLTSPDTVTVDGTAYKGRHLVLATGSYAKTLPGLEISGRVMTSDEALTYDRVPDSVVVLGGGVIGSEFASVWRSFGSEVTIIEALPRLLAAEDASCSKVLERTFRKRGINVKTGVTFANAVDNDSNVTVNLDDGTSIVADLLLVAIGRGPRTDGLGYEQAGVAMDRGFVPVNDQLETNIAGIYAVGDIVPGLQLAHRGFAQGIFVAERIAGLNPRPIDEEGIPRVAYCEPEVASVGLTEVIAKERFGDDAVEVYEYNLGGNGKSQILATAGVIKLVSLKDGPVIGIHMVGSRVGELVGEAQLIVNWQAEADDVASLVHAHPTQNEALGEAHLALAGKPLHAHA